MSSRFSLRRVFRQRREGIVDAVNNEATVPASCHSSQNGGGISILAEATPESTAADRYGLFLLNKEASSHTTYNLDVVAVHGLGGDAYKTWTHENGKLWLRDLLVDDLPGARIFTYGYNSAFVFSRETSTLKEYARMLLEAIRSERTSTEVRYE